VRLGFEVELEQFRKKQSSLLLAVLICINIMGEDEGGGTEKD